MLATLTTSSQQPTIRTKDYDIQVSCMQIQHSAMRRLAERCAAPIQRHWSHTDAPSLTGSLYTCSLVMARLRCCTSSITCTLTPGAPGRSTARPHAASNVRMLVSNAPSRSGGASSQGTSISSTSVFILLDIRNGAHAAATPRAGQQLQAELFTHCSSMPQTAQRPWHHNCGTQYLLMLHVIKFLKNHDQARHHNSIIYQVQATQSSTPAVMPYAVCNALSCHT